MKAEKNLASRLTNMRLCETKTLSSQFNLSILSMRLFLQTKIYCDLVELQREESGVNKVNAVQQQNKISKHLFRS